MKKEFNFFDNPKNVKRFIKLFYGVCLTLLIINFFVPTHGHFFWEERLGFYAVYGFVACVILVLAAKYILRPFVKRRKDYYD
jgi:hypothetical protein|tara:strand:+ start:6842 stop:7087 length:246 start_codon:yes stop_codon:yes gene_type:complete